MSSLRGLVCGHGIYGFKTHFFRFCFYRFELVLKVFLFLQPFFKALNYGLKQDCFDIR